jgi:hypothetical protein
VKIFISYRREGSSDIVGRLRDHLAPEFGDESIFVDVFSIEIGEDFRDVVRTALKHIDAFILVIGPSFDTKRLSEPGDPLCMEIEEALALGKRLFPVLHGGARMVEAGTLPGTIRKLADINAGQLRSDPDFERDARAIVDRLRDPLRGHQRRSAWRYQLRNRVPPALRTRRAVIASIGVALVAALGFVWSRPKPSVKNLLSPQAAWVADDPVLRSHVKKIRCHAGDWLTQLESDRYETTDRNQMHALAIGFPGSILIDTARSCPGLRVPYDRLIFGIGPYPSPEVADSACAATGRDSNNCFRNSTMDSYETVTPSDRCPRSDVPSLVVLAGMTKKSRLMVCRSDGDDLAPYSIFRFDRASGNTQALAAVRNDDGSIVATTGTTTVTVTANRLQRTTTGKVDEDEAFLSVSGSL